jgi:hypothetical protein
MWQDDSFTDEVMMKLKSILFISQIHYISEFQDRKECFKFMVAHHPVEFRIYPNGCKEVNEVVKKGVDCFVNYLLDVWGKTEQNPQAPAGHDLIHE